MRPWRLLNIEGSILKYTARPLWTSYMGERRATFAKEYGINLRCYWERFEEQVRNLRTLGGNMWETWELFGGTSQKLGNSLLWSPPPPPPNKKLACKVHCPSGKWTAHSPHQTQLEKKNQSQKEKKGGPFTPWLDFALVAWKFYS
jgi:hypothetical protein